MITCATVGLLCGCASPIFKKVQLSEGNSLSLDAKQRVITNLEIDPSSRPGQVVPKRIICAEPSPDVATAIANSFSAGLSLFDKGTGSVSNQQVEGLAQLAERTVTVQLLRDQMYRACEQYANGAISGTGYTLLMTRNNEAMITLMLGELAVGAYGRSGATLGGKSTGEAMAKLEGLAAEFEEALDKQTQAELKVAEASSVLKEKKALVENFQPDENDSEETKKEKLEQLKEDVIAAELSLQAAQQAAVAAATNLSIASESQAKGTAEILNNSGVGAIAANPSAEIAKVIERVQEAYVSDSFTDEYLSSCVVELGAAPSIYDQDFYDTRRRLLDAAQNMQLELRDYYKDNSTHKISNYKRFELLLADMQKNGIALMNMGRHTLLSDHCQQNMYSVIENQTLREHELDILKLQMAAAGKALDIKETFQYCDSLKTEEQKQQCRNTVAKTVDPNSKRVEPASEEPPRSKDEAISLVVKFTEAQRLSIPFKSSVAELEALTVKVGELDEQKSLSEKLVAEKTSIITQLKAFITSLDSEITASKLARIQTLEMEQQGLIGELAAARKLENELDIAELRAKISLKQIEAKRLLAIYIELISTMQEKKNNIDQFKNKIEVHNRNVQNN